MLKNTKIRYGEKEVTIQIPEKWRLLFTGAPRNVAGIRDEIEEIRRAIRNPIGSKRLQQLVGPRKKIVIVSDDVARPTPTRKIVPTLLEELRKSGAKEENIKIVIGRGTHRPLSKNEFRTKFGDKVVEEIQVKDHDCDNKDKLAYFGKTSRGTRIWLNKTVADADVKIGVGSIAPHPFAGYGGGAKIIVPGVSGRETINDNHLMVNTPNAQMGIADGNPIREDMEEIARKIVLDMKIDVVLNATMEIVKVFAGDFVEAHREGIRLSKRVCGVEVPKIADVVIASGYPLDIWLLQATKGAFAADMVTKQGGDVILASPCREGIGPSQIFGSQLVRWGDKPHEFFEQMKNGEEDIPYGTTTYEVAKILSRKGLTLVTDGITEQEVRAMHMNYASTIEEAIENMQKKHAKADVIVFPAGSMTLPLIRV